MPSTNEIAQGETVALPTPAGGEPSTEGDWRTPPVQESYATLEAFLRLAPDAIVVTNEMGMMVLMNGLAEQMFGYQKDEILGRRAELLMPEPQDKSHEVQRSTIHPMASLRPLGSVQALTGLQKNGTEIPLEVSVSPLQTERGTLVVSIIRDITDRIRAEAKFRGFLESAPDAVVVVNRDGFIAIVNTLTEKMFGYARDELLGKPVEILVPQRFRGAHVGDRQGYSQDPHTRPMGAGQELWGRRRDASEFPVEISLSPLKTEQGTLITSIIRDITERRDTEERIKASLREKEVLLKEIHHRVKNNLQVTSSLLKLQSAYIQDPQALAMFGDSQNRIRSMALVHEKLYQSSDLSRVNFSDYVESLAALLFRSYGVDTNLIRLHIEADQAFLSIETAVPCGLILNELLSNCLKHAFPEKRAGEIRIKVAEEVASESLTLAVSDNGVGLPKGMNPEQSETLGLQLVRTLTRQLNGKLELSSADWTEFKVRFPTSKSS